MTDAPSATLTFAQAMATVAALIDAQPDPAKTDLKNAIAWLEPAIKAEVNTAITAYASKTPIGGGFIGDAVTAGLDKALDEGLVQITA